MVAESSQVRNDHAEAAAALAKLWWLSLVRGAIALGLGLALLLAPSMGRPLLAQYMGMYWMASGLLSIVWGVRGARFTRLWLLAGSVGLIGGLAIVLRALYAPPMDVGLVVTLFGIVAVLTGLLHMAGGYRVRQEYGPRWSRGSFLLGLVQLVLGLLVLLAPGKVPRIVILLAVAWALIGGLGLIRDALQLRSHRHSASTPPAGDAVEQIFPPQPPADG
ncbi:MAG: DUF308 domain-containing protein [Anaerolineae bacterium]|jgi:uncharacterized membrane protein HdeD (DUF308 family)